MQQIKRILKHTFTSKLILYKYFKPKDLKLIKTRIAKSELQHRAEIRFAVEVNFSLGEILKKITPRQKAIQAFSFLNIWDTEENNGVLIYLSLADKSLEIIVDRGIYKKLEQTYWDKIANQIVHDFKEKKYLHAILQAIEIITKDMITLYPKYPSGDPNELSDDVAIL